MKKPTSLSQIDRLVSLKSKKARDRDVVHFFLPDAYKCNELRIDSDGASACKISIAQNLLLSRYARWAYSCNKKTMREDSMYRRNAKLFGLIVLDKDTPSAG